jgi:endogenous inhibitor of DNA gyrase (YacG/DUF329 family)
VRSRAQAEPHRAKDAKTGQAQERQTRKQTKRCPICGKPEVREFRPFCSKHCADIDLGHWLGGRYAVPGAPAGPSEENEKEP